MQGFNKDDINWDLKDAAIAETRRTKRHKWLRVSITVLFIIFVLMAVVVAAEAIIVKKGEKSLRYEATPNIPEDNMSVAKQQEVTQTTHWEEGWIRYNDGIYEYNEDIITILFIGVDDMGVVKENKDEVSGGQADALFLLVANPIDESLKIVAVNRDSMTDIVMYGYEGSTDETASTMYAQIATQHGFGDGMEKSCELTVDAVSGLMYDLPIHGYVSINMGAIPALNDEVGGVTVTVLEDIDAPQNQAFFTKGETILLEGKDAFWYVKYRDTTQFESNRNRLNRQKQYLSEFSKQALEATKKDITIPLDLYQRLDEYMVTDLTAEEVTFLASELSGYTFSEGDVYTLEGETNMGEKHEEFYPDKEALKNLVLDVFYREVEEP